MANQKYHLKDFTLKLAENSMVSVKYIKGISCETSFSWSAFPACVTDIKTFKKLPAEMKCKRCSAKLKSRIEELKK
jgi:hypothetical protein